MVPDFDNIKGESYFQIFSEDSILNKAIDEKTTQKLLSKHDLSCLKRLVVKFRIHLNEGNENIEIFGKKEDVILDHAVFISDLMIKRTETLQAAAKHEKDKNNRSEHFMEVLGLFKKGLIAFENQQSQLRRHLARLTYATTEEGAAYFKEKAREELTVLVKQRIEEYKKAELEMKNQDGKPVGKEAQKDISPDVPS